MDKTRSSSDCGLFDANLKLAWRHSACLLLCARPVILSAPMSFFKFAELDGSIDGAPVDAFDLLPVSWIAESWKIPVLKRGPETERAMKRSKFTEAQIAFI